MTQPIRHSQSDTPIQSLWIGTIGPLEYLSMASFIAHGHNYHLYAYDDVGRVPAGVHIKDASAILPASHIFTHARGKEKGGYSGFADLFRYKLLAINGGWWVDTDMICLQPFTADTSHVFASEDCRWGGTKICIAVMKAPQDDACMRDCYAAATRHDPMHLRFAQNGEPIVKRMVKRHQLRHCIAPPARYNPIPWWQSHKMGARGSAALLGQMQDAVHLYAESWRWRLRDRAGINARTDVFAPDTVLGALQRQYVSRVA